MEIANHSKIYPNWDFGYENIPSSNPATTLQNVKSVLKNFAAIVHERP
jgi:hypothetical protein